MIITYNFLNVGQTGYEGTVENLSVNSAIMHRVNVCGRGGGHSPTSSNDVSEGRKKGIMSVFLKYCCTQNQ